MDRVSLLQRAEILKAAQVVKVDLAIIFAPRPPALWVRAGIQEQAVGVPRSFVIGCSLRATTRLCENTQLHLKRVVADSVPLFT